MNKILFTEKADIDTSATMIRTNDHVRIGDRIYWVWLPLPRPFIRTDTKERGWLFHAIEIEDKVALETIKAIGVFTDLNPEQVEISLYQPDKGSRGPMTPSARATDVSFICENCGHITKGYKEKVEDRQCGSCKSRDIFPTEATEAIEDRITELLKRISNLQRSSLYTSKPKGDGQ